MKPPTGWVKLYVDRSCRGILGSCGEGDIIQDDTESFLRGFSEKFESNTNNSAKLQALIYGVRICKDMGYH